MAQLSGSGEVRIPQGLQSILEQLTAAIVKERPEKINDFAVTFFEKLLTERQNNKGPNTQGSAKLPTEHELPLKSIKPRKSTEEIDRLESTSRPSSPTNSDLDSRALKPLESRDSIIITPRKKENDSDPVRSSPDKPDEPHLGEKTEGKHGLSEDEAAVRIQATYRGYRTRRSLATKDGSKPDIDQAQLADSNGHKSPTENGEKEKPPGKGELCTLPNTDDAAESDGLKSSFDPEDENDDEEEIWRKLQRDISLDEEEQRKAAVKIQACARGYLTRKHLKEEKMNPYNEKENTDVNLLDKLEALETSPAEVEEQANSLESLTGLKELPVVTEYETRRQAAVTIQAHTRGYLTRKHLNEQHHDQSAEGNNLIAAEDVDGDVAEQEPMEIQQIFTKEEVQNLAAVKIQACTRGYLTRKHLKEEKQQQLHHNSAAETNNQAEDKESIGEQVEPPIEESSIADSYAEVQRQAAVKIQARVRGYLTRKHLNNPYVPAQINEETGSITQDLQAEDEYLRNQAAVKIQAHARGYLTRKHLKERMSLEDVRTAPAEIADKLDEANTSPGQKLTDEETRRQAAVKIQAHARGYLTRKHLKDRVDPSKVQNEEIIEALETDIVDDTDGQDTRLVDEDVERESAPETEAHSEGYSTRKHLNEKSPTEVEESEDVASGKVVTSSPASMINQGDNLTEDEMETKAAVKIQAQTRGYLARKHLKEQLDVSRTDGSAENIVLDETFIASDTAVEQQGDTAAEEVVANDEEEVQRKAAVKIQAGARGYLTRKRLKEEQGKHLGVEPPNQMSDDGPHDECDDDYIQQQAAVKIQAHARGYLTRKHLKQDNGRTQDVADTANEEEKMDAVVEEADNQPLAVEFPSDEESRNRAAVTIQAYARGYMARKHLKEKIYQLLPSPEERTSPGLETVDIADHYTNKQHNDEDFLNQAATKIQAYTRGYLTRKHLKLDKERGEGNNAALSYETPGIQDQEYHEEQRGESCSAVNGTEKLNGDLSIHPDAGNLTPEAYSQSEEEAAIRLQAHTRGYLTRKRLKQQQEDVPCHTMTSTADVGTEGNEPELKNEHEERPRPSNVDEEQAAVKIQAYARGYLARKHLKDADAGRKMQSGPSENLNSKTETTAQTAEQRVERDELEEQAAIKIQAQVRGHLTRKHLKESKLKEDELKDSSEELL